MDSLMAGQVRNWIAKHLEMDFPIMGLMRGPTITKLAAEVLAQLFGTRAADSVGTATVAPVESKSSVDQWFYRPRPKSETASLRIFGLPFVGGGASVFSSWADNLPDAVEVVGVEYPGRETRINEPPFDRMPQLVEALGEAMLPYLDRSFVLYGHSMGALLSFELAKYLQTRYSEIPAKLIVGGWLSPELVQSYVHGLDGIEPGVDIDAYSDDRVIEILRANRLFVEDDGADRAFISSIMKSVRADLSMLGNYRFDPSVKLRCPITVIGGQSDPLFTTQQLASWQTLTTQSFALRSVPGSHLFIRRPSQELFSILIDELSAGTIPSFFDVFEAAAE
jgi:surfactin synthase thioesterase subunit